MNRQRLIGLLCALVLLISSAQAELYHVSGEADVPADWADRETLRVTCIDTDRSDAILLECGGEAMMVDGGSGQYRSRVYATLDAANITTLKYLFATHSDNDHVHGFIYLIRSGLYQVDALLSANDTAYQDKSGYHQLLVKAANAMNVPYVQIYDGDELTLGSATIEVMRCSEAWGANARSATCMVRLGTSRIFLTGDIDNVTMQWYAETYGDRLTCNLLKIPHHGLASIPQSFLEATQPQAVFVPSTSKRCEAKFAGWARKYLPADGVYYSGDGSVVMLTDGTDWYMWQEPNYVVPET